MDTAGLHPITMRFALFWRRLGIHTTLWQKSFFQNQTTSSMYRMETGYFPGQVWEM